MKKNIYETEGFKHLTKNFEEIKSKKITTLFKENTNRTNALCFKWNEFFFDFSKNHITSQTISHFTQIAEELNFKSEVSNLYSGKTINTTENRAVLHTALRYSGQSKIMVNNNDVMPKVKVELQKMETFTSALHQNKILGYSGKPIKKIVNIGIGGSHLGPEMVTFALKPYAIYNIDVFFISNIDGANISEVLKQCQPEETLFIVASKTFTTQETLTNAQTAKSWIISYFNHPDAVKNHFVAISTNFKEVTEFGISKQYIFEFWDWVGGRFSLWSSIGLSICCSIGYKNFEQLLKGAELMDQHFYHADLSENIPFLMASLSIWYTHFFDAHTLAVIPYDYYLEKFPQFLQQAEMESNGKHTDRNGKRVNYHTGQIVWGQTGTNGQHAFFQLLHQGSRYVPADFICFVNPQNNLHNHHDILLTNLFAQTKALMEGKNEQDVVAELKQKNLTEKEVNEIKNFKIFDGNKPSTTILIKKLTPKNLGSLIALYEHKVYAQGILWNINSFDQMGVELGKELAKNLLPSVQSNGSEQLCYDESTNKLIQTVFDFKN